MERKKSIDNLKCPLCREYSENEEALIRHVSKHIGYKRYPCSTCGSKFFNENDREEHCNLKKHDHTYQLEQNLYCEMLLSMIAQDADLLRTCDMNTIIAGRRRVNIEFHQSMQNNGIKKSPEALKTPDKITNNTQRLTPTTTFYTKKRRYDSEPSSEIRSISQRSPSVTRKCSSEATSSKRRFTSASNASLQETHTSRLTYSETYGSSCRTPQSAANIPVSMTVSVSDPPNLSIPILPKTYIRCDICRQQVEKDYILRKDHVSRMHVGSNHTEEDYIPILEDSMRRAFYDVTYSDLQCQKCRMTYESYSGRRKHVQDKHILQMLECPLNCGFGAYTSQAVNKHIKNEHQMHYTDIPEKEIVDKYIKEFREYNVHVQMLNEQCFPCKIPEYYLKKAKEMEPSPRTASLISAMRERVYQQIPDVRRRRRFSESSASDSGDELPLKCNDQHAVVGSTRSNDHFVKREIESPIDFAAEDCDSIIWE